MAKRPKLSVEEKIAAASAAANARVAAGENPFPKATRPAVWQLQDEVDRRITTAPHRRANDDGAGRLRRSPP